MDPSAALATLRELADDALNGKDVDPQDLAELFDGLDTWLSKGGFLPSAWTRS